MGIDRQTVAAVAKLARLELSQDKIDLFAAQLDDVLAYMEKLNGLDTAGVEPMYSPVEHVSVMRPDEARKRFERSDVLGNAPETDGTFFVVPRIL